MKTVHPRRACGVGALDGDLPTIAYTDGPQPRTLRWRYDSALASVFKESKPAHLDPGAIASPARPGAGVGTSGGPLDVTPPPNLDREESRGDG